MEIKSTIDIKPDKFNCLVYGESGVGKTTLASTLDNCLIVSMESGLLSLKDYEVDYIEVNSLEKLKSVLTEAANSSYDTIFIDSLTEIAQLMVAHCKTVYPNDNQVMKVYGLYNDMITKMIKFTRDMNKNVVYTALEKVDKDNVGVRFHLPDLSGSIATKCPALFDFVFNLSVFEQDEKEVRALLTSNKNNYICKSRTRNLSEYEPANLGKVINKAFNIKE